MGEELGSSLDGIAVASVGIYCVMVWGNGNGEILIDKLKQETPFLEFLVGAAILSWAVKNDFTGIAAPLAILAATSIALRLSGRYSITDALAGFASGQYGLFQTITLIGKSAGN